MSGNPDVQSIAQFELQACACEMLVSNLGVLPFAPDFGGLTLEAFWGPSVLVGIEGEQMIGARMIGQATGFAGPDWLDINGRQRRLNPRYPHILPGDARSAGMDHANRPGTRDVVS